MTEEFSGDLMARWRNGDEQAAAALFHRYRERLVALARNHLPSRLSARVDPEDVVQSVCRCFFAAARQGRYQVEHGGDLWRLLVSITLRKLAKQVQRHSAEKRSVSREKNFSGADSFQALEDDVLAQGPSPLTVVTLADQLEQVMRRLGPFERRVLELRLQECTHPEIAAALDCSERTIIRSLKEIKRLLEQWPFEDLGP
jgi:RNA polymerase sigma factor (sigma-70 family)